ncbi:hypothetical protein N7481_003312 [Penicillium waksmanii]|uniref:uncharacterized protein n=1 Tax=Penicillium waksmanii TaxID=69791 RepID=UPI0025467FB3|nr:uncharacterized protein N7481_003312 [Penicillium waksmanii]KAJ5988102.1 hypothetical protein N7481_003312 [Penicillium waksmanii]
MGSIGELSNRHTARELASTLATDGGFPNDLIFSTFLLRCRNAGTRVAFHEPDNGVRATFDQFMTDIIHQRHHLRKHLVPHLDENGILEEAFPICVLSTANYEFSIAAMAIMALGGLVVPLPLDSSGAFVLNILRQAPTKVLLASQRYVHEATKIQQLASAQSLPSITLLLIDSLHDSPTNLWDIFDAGIHTEFSISESRPGITLFTSGSTGTPKGVIHSRGWFPKLPQAPADEAVLVHRPPSWLGGSLFLFTAIMTASRAEIVDPGATLRYTWERIRRDGITYINSGCGWWEQMVTFYKAELQNHPQKEEYLAGIGGVRSAFTGSSVAVPSLLQFISGEFKLRLQMTYGTTEVGRMLLGIPLQELKRSDRCLGRPLWPDMPVKLSEGDKGELLVGRMRTFLGYINGEPSTEGLFDEDGYFRTGDIAHRQDDCYVFDGRVSIDFIKNAGEKVPVIELEQVIRGLDYVAEAYVVPVKDNVLGSRLGVLLKSKGGKVTLKSLRADLASKVGSHMLPNAFCLMAENERVPKTPTDKVSKSELVNVFFPDCAEKILHDRVEILDIEI